MREKSRSAIRMACVGAMLGPCACVTYEAELDRHFERGNLRVHLQEAQAVRAGDARVELAFERVPRNVRLLRATLGSPPNAYCELGVNAEGLERASHGDAKAALVPGERLTLGFRAPAFSSLLEGSAELDLLLLTPSGSQRCVPIPIARDPGADLHWQPRQRWTLGLALSFHGFLLGPTTGVISFPLELGVWLGGYHAELGIGVGGATCSADRCEPDESSGDTSPNASTVFPMYVGLRRPLWESGEYSLGAAIQYRAVRLAADTFEGMQRFWAHGAVVSPYVGAVPLVDEEVGAAGGARRGWLGVNVPVGYLVAEGGESSLSVGIELATSFPFF